MAMENAGKRNDLNCFEYSLNNKFAILLTLILEYEESDELIGDPTSNFCCDGGESFEFSLSITLLVADDETFLRNFAPPLLSNSKKIFLITLHSYVEIVARISKLFE